jgi:recombination protein RecA
VRTAIFKTEIESALAKRFGSLLPPHAEFSFKAQTTGIAEIDALSNGLPRSAITEIIGATSSGRTSVLFSILAQATWSDEVCALIDMGDRFDPASAAHAGIALDRLLWIRCANNLERGFKAIDLVLQSGGFGLVMLDMADVSAQHARRIVASWWYRFRRVIERTPTALVVISQTSCVRSCASLSLELKPNSPAWSCPKKAIEAVLRVDSPSRFEDARLVLVSGLGQRNECFDPFPTHSLLLSGTGVQINQRKPISSDPTAKFRAHTATACPNLTAFADIR